MKNKFLSILSLTAVLAFTSCSDDDSPDSVNNGNKKYITNVSVIPADSSEESGSLTVMYDGNGRVTRASDGQETSIFAYDNGNLANVSGSSDVLTINDLYADPYDGYEFGEVIDYDNNGNPIEIRLFERDYDGSIMAQFTSTVTYDQKPNPFFYMLEAAGIIEVLDNVNLNFSATPQAEELINAKMLLPVNNLKKVVIKNESGEVVSQLVADYTYDSDNYPTTATFTTTDEDGSTHIYAATYTYKQ